MERNKIAQLECLESNWLVLSIRPIRVVQVERVALPTPLVEWFEKHTVLIYKKRLAESKFIANSQRTENETPGPEILVVKWSSAAGMRARRLSTRW